MSRSHSRRPAVRTHVLTLMALLPLADNESADLQPRWLPVSARDFHPPVAVRLGVSTCRDSR